MFLVYAAGVFWVYRDRGWGNVNEVIRIPIIDYLGVFLLAGIIGVLVRLAPLFAGTANRRPDESAGA